MTLLTFLDIFLYILYIQCLVAVCQPFIKLLTYLLTSAIDCNGVYSWTRDITYYVSVLIRECSLTKTVPSCRRKDTPTKCGSAIFTLRDMPYAVHLHGKRKILNERCLY